MSNFFSKRSRVLLMVIMVLILGTAAYGFANSMDMTGISVNAAEGSTTVSGYVVSSLDFTLNPSDPTTFSGLTFHLDGPADTVYVGLTTTSGTTWYLCTPTPNAGETDVSCPNISGAAVLPVTGLSISAVQ